MKEGEGRVDRRQSVSVMDSRSCLDLPIDSFTRIGGIAPVGTSLLARSVFFMQISEPLADAFSVEQT